MSWTLIKHTKNEVIYKGSDGDQIYVIHKPNFQGDKNTNWLMSAAGMLHVKKATTLPQALRFAKIYIKAHPNG